MEVLFVLLAALMLIVTSVLLNGYVLSVLWTWFMVPVFDVPELTVPMAIGLGLIVSFLTHQDQPPRQERADPTMTLFVATVTLFAKAGTVLLMGWIVHQFM